MQNIRQLLLVGCIMLQQLYGNSGICCGNVNGGGEIICTMLLLLLSCCPWRQRVKFMIPSGGRCTDLQLSWEPRGEVLHERVVMIQGGFPLRPYLLGDAGYQQQVYCMTPVSRSPSTAPIMKFYNNMHIQGWLIVEQSFGRLKRRSRMLDIEIQSDVSWASYLVHSACILNKFLITVGDLFEPDEPLNASPNDDTQEESNICPNPPVSEYAAIGGFIPPPVVATESSVSVHDGIDGSNSRVPPELSLRF
ncbi:hypothetical protein R1sor_019611 [Riccia sorocarpa]|uniref:DDE Tnp4 domain-containing protein n=1 Tax=Riccia sorocarpa TaxID=122646 RepID=A0ABD3IEQ8_9MARC